MYFAHIARMSRSLLTLNRDREYATLRRMLAFSTTDTVLDAGSGDGFWTARFATHCAWVTGLEPGRQTLEYARTLHQRPNVVYVCGVAESLPFPNSTFDKVVSISCLEHFADPLQGLREMTRVLKPGGRLALSVDSLLPENSPLSFREWHKRRHFVTHYFSQEKLLDMLKTVGLCCETERTMHLFRSRLAAHLRQLFIRHPRFWLPFFPLLYGVVRLADWLADDMHGQIIIVTATR
jgi:ubiquinone/menaquinone biosynthesis C-methylase UbiE